MENQSLNHSRGRWKINSRRSIRQKWVLLRLFRQQIYCILFYIFVDLNGSSYLWDSVIIRRSFILSPRIFYNSEIDCDSIILRLCVGLSSIITKVVLIGAGITSSTTLHLLRIYQNVKTSTSHFALPTNHSYHSSSFLPYSLPEVSNSYQIHSIG